MSGFKRAIVVLVLALCALPATARRASAVTIDQIVALAKAGISEPVILALIDRDRTIFTIDPEQLVALKQEGLSDTVLVAMLKSGRAEGEAAFREQAAANAAAILSTLTTAPELVIVGHGPEYPNGHRYEPYSDGFGVPTYPIVPAPYLSPYAPPALLIQSAPCVPHRGSTTPCAAPIRRGRVIR
ncbi:MAG TPA: hypothetical protein VKH42_10105 [Vicinamibacterales bacterium]|nr:hypothetical protein [Vicinamibacterales bacterium]